MVQSATLSLRVAFQRLYHKVTLSYNADIETYISVSKRMCWNSFYFRFFFS